MVQWLIHTRLFSRRVPAESDFAIVKWWELRRIPYNIIVGIAGIVGTSVALAGGLFGESRGIELPWPDSPLFFMVWVALYGIAANICFTGGWVSETLARRIWGARAEAYGEISFFLGTLFSVILTLFPGFFYALAGVVYVFWPW